jgi:CCR4-NOT transcriptional complex subunit CAF120
MYQQYPQQDYRASQSQYGNMGQYPQQYPIQAQGQQQWGMSPAANVYAQGGGFTAPSTHYGVPETGRQSPSMQQFPQQSQNFNQQQQGSQGQGGRGYHQGQQ